MNQFFRSLYYDVKHIIENLILLYKFPKRKVTHQDLKYNFRKLYDTVFNHPWYCLKRGVRNLFIFFPIVWRNDVYDYCYLLTLMDKQLAEMETFFKSGKTHCVGANHRGKRIAWIRKLMQMSRDEYYTMKHYDEHFKNTGHRLMDFEPVEHDEYGVATLFQSKDNWDTEDKQKYREGSEKARKMDEKVWLLLWKNMKLSNNFWD